MILKKMLITGSVLGLLLSFSVGTVTDTNSGSANAYPTRYLNCHSTSMMFVTRDYIGHSKNHSTESCSQSMANKIDNYLRSIKNIKDYKVSVRSNVNSDEVPYTNNLNHFIASYGETNEHTLADYVQLTRK